MIVFIAPIKAKITAKATASIAALIRYDMLFLSPDGFETNEKRLNLRIRYMVPRAVQTKSEAIRIIQSVIFYFSVLLFSFFLISRIFDGISLSGSVL